MNLYHFTNGPNLAGILDDGRIMTTTEKRGSPRWVAGAPVTSDADRAVEDVVWLTTDGTTEQAWSTDVADADSIFAPDGKTGFRLEVDPADAERWHRYADRRGIPWQYRRMLAYEGTRPDSWWVVERAITVDDWVELTDHQGQVLWRRGDPLPTVSRDAERVTVQFAEAAA